MRIYEDGGCVKVFFFVLYAVRAPPQLKTGAPAAKILEVGARGGWVLSQFDIF